MSRSYPVDPGNVYVWRGFRSATKSQDDFAKFLGTVFVPACALLQPKVGLRAYLPTMVPQVGKPAAVPDQTALMWWATPTAHDEAFEALAVRVYSNLHGDAYDMTRSHTPEVPTALGATLTQDQPVYLLDGRADWMLGRVFELVATPKAGVDTAALLAAAYTWAAGFRASPPAGAQGALLVVGDGYLAAWICGAAGGGDLSGAFAGLLDRTDPVLQREARHLTLGAGLWDDWAGLDLTVDDCVNIQLVRPRVATPRPVKGAAS